MISRGIDVSFGSSLSLASVVIALLYANGINIYLALIAALLLCTAVGFVNGLLIEFFNLNALIATLGTMSMYMALALVIAKGDATIGILAEGLLALSFGSFFKVPMLLWVFIFLILIYYFVLNYTLAGRIVFLIGANPLAAYSVGVRVKKTRIILYAFFGLMVGIAAIFTTGLIGTGSAFHGVNLLLPVLSAILLGGIGLEGGSGTIWGTILGVLIISIIFNGLAVLGVSADISKVIQGLLLVILVSIYEVRSKKMSE
jgi:ribose/xylose/arabinose/galactoside ABC-type transport system permease subunit